MNTNLPRPGHAKLRAGRWSQAGQVYHITATTQQREPWFSNPDAAQAAANTFRSKVLLRDSKLLAWVLMPDHAHWLLQVGENDRLSDCMERLKSASSRAANKALDRHGAIWSQAFHDHAIRQEEDVKSVARYIVANPLRAGLVSKIDDYAYWDAIWIERDGTGLG